ncbi:hypothetical protein GpartN1_g3072.t1 [Galdieria partita]|uniref:gamma-glutamylcyclotransferase n=1 Tax=Galdieria partita TaxID=83374 RepID=A0A9C7PWV1_9RHOD|nr:hypothetical protein GpartN1_g3072.t1 [Galdieria partita]
MIDQQDDVYYFSFGANMSPSAFGPKAKGRYVQRNCFPKEAFPAKLSGWKLVFNLRGVPGIEPGFGNIVPDNNSCVHGVCYLLKQEDFLRLRQSEFTYDVKLLEVEEYNQRKVIANVFIVTDKKHLEPCPKCAIPSKRYRDLLVSGAKHWGLDSGYIEFLERTPYQKPTIFSKAMSLLLFWFLFYFLSFLGVPLKLRGRLFRSIATWLWKIVDWKRKWFHSHSYNEVFW